MTKSTQVPVTTLFSTQAQLHNCNVITFTAVKLEIVPLISVNVNLAAGKLRHYSRDALVYIPIG